MIVEYVVILVVILVFDCCISSLYELKPEPPFGGQGSDCRIELLVPLSPLHGNRGGF